MGNVKTTIKKVEFILEDELTHCNVFYKSSEPGAIAWGGGWKTKAFGSSVAVVDIIKDQIQDYIIWPAGRYKDEE